VEITYSSAINQDNAVSSISDILT